MKLAINGAKPVRQKTYPRWPEVDESDERSVMSVVRSGKWWLYAYSKEEFATSGEGCSQVVAFENEFAKIHNSKHAYAVSSGTGALEIACRAIGLEPGDEVITTPYTFVATSSCILNAGAIPVYVDIEPDTYNLNPDLVEDAVTDRTRAIIPVHFGGIFADMEKLRKIAEKHRLKIIEDAAHSHGASLKGNQWAGTLGDIGIFSLQESKLLTAGEGGVITTNDEELAELSWSLRHCGRLREGKWYEHSRVGWNYRMTELQGALLISQLKKLPMQNERRRANARILYKELTAVPGVQMNRQRPATEHDVYYLFCLRYDPERWDGISRLKVVQALNAEGIPISEGYNFPLYENPLFLNVNFNKPGSVYMTDRARPIRDYGTYRESCPVAERACRIESMWIAQNLLLGSEDDTRDIVRAFEKVYANRSELR